MNREEFLLIKGKNKSPSTVSNYKKALKKLDNYLNDKNYNEGNWLDKLKGSSVEDLCKTWQDIIDFINGQVSARVTKEYFETIESYLGFFNIVISERQRKDRVFFPRSSKARFEGLDEIMIKRILEVETDPNMKAYYSLLYGGGLRETEALRVTPSMIMFNENPMRLILPKEITKFSIPRETFISTIPGTRIKNLVYAKRIKNDQTIFAEYNESTLIKFEKHFAKLRASIGYDTANRKPHQQNDITLHSFRAYFTTVFMDNGLDYFGLAVTGHTKYMDTYFRKSLNQRQITFNQVAEKLNF